VLNYLNNGTNNYDKILHIMRGTTAYNGHGQIQAHTN